MLFCDFVWHGGIVGMYPDYEHLQWWLANADIGRNALF
jgi:hypothetical protein